jgi:hypothetical protein
MLKVANSVISATRITGTLPVANGGTGVTTSTGTGNTVLSASPTFTGTAVFATLSGTGYSLSGSAAANSLTLDANGRLMVGAATNDGEKLKVATSANTYLSIIAGSSSVSQLWFGDADVNVGLIGYDHSGDFMIFRVNGSEKMRISSLGVVTMSAYGAGTATFSAAGVISSVSDETWKIKDGIPTNPDAMLNKLEPGYWHYNDEKKEIFGTDRQLGFYAQNVNAAIGPEAAPEPEEGKPWGYYDRSVLAVTVMSLQKALATIKLLTSRIATLENK